MSIYIIERFNLSIAPELLLNNKKRQNATWSLDSGYDENVPIKDSFPVRVLEHGEENEVSFMLISSKSDFDYSVSYVQGYKVCSSQLI